MTLTGMSAAHSNPSTETTNRDNTLAQGGFQEGDVIGSSGIMVGGEGENFPSQGAQYQYRPTGAPVDPTTLPTDVQVVYHEGQWYRTRMATAMDFVAHFEIPDFDTTLYLIENFDFLDPDEIIQETMDRNILLFPMQAALATAETQTAAAALNEFNLEQFNIAAEDILPGHKTLMSQASEVIADQLAGELPSDIAEIVKIQAAENARNQGVGNIRAGNISARDLGLTSAAMQQQGLDNNINIQTLTSDTANALLTDTGLMVRDFANIVVNNTSATPFQTTQLHQQSEFNQIQVEQFNVGARTSNQAIRNDVNLAVSEIQYINEQNRLDAQNVAIADFQARRASSHTSGMGAILSIAGAVVGTFFGMPTLGAMIGGAIGGSIDSGSQGGSRVTGAAEGAVEGAAVGSTMEAGLDELRAALAKKVTTPPAPAVAPTGTYDPPTSTIPPGSPGTMTSPSHGSYTPPGVPTSGGTTAQFDVRRTSNLYA